MKKTFIAALIILISFSTIYAQTEGVLTVTTTTSNAGGNYAPRNIVAIWIEDDQGSFVKTLLAYAATRITHLNTWEASTTAAGTPFNTVDAITGATRTSHDVRTCTWNSTDVNGAVVPDGTYRIRMELTDKNSTGNFSTFTFTKGPEAENQAPANVPSFSSITINWEPIITGVDDQSLASNYQICPNPSTGNFRITGENIFGIQVMDITGNLIFQGNSNVVDINHHPDGIYFIRIRTGKDIAIKKIVKGGIKIL